MTKLHSIDWPTGKTICKLIQAKNDGFQFSAIKTRIGSDFNKAWAIGMMDSVTNPNWAKRF